LNFGWTVSHDFFEAIGFCQFFLSEIWQLGTQNGNVNTKNVYEIPKIFLILELCKLEWVEKGLFSWSHLYLWFSLNLIFSKNFCIFFFPDPATKPPKILRFGLKLTILAIFTRNAIFLMIFCLFRIESSLNSIKKTLEPKPSSRPFGRGGQEKISIFNDLMFSWLFHLQPLYLSLEMLPKK
jgi:hypothetical protein